MECKGVGANLEKLIDFEVRVRNRTRALSEMLFNYPRSNTDRESYNPSSRVRMISRYTAPSKIITQLDSKSEKQNESAFRNAFQLSKKIKQTENHIILVVELG
jgi:hypothetical protein